MRAPAKGKGRVSARGAPVFMRGVATPCGTTDTGGEQVELRLALPWVSVTRRHVVTNHAA
jgi:hypothetical protein